MNPNSALSAWQLAVMAVVAWRQTRMVPPLAVAAADSLGTRTLARFVGSAVEGEDFYLYSVTAANDP